jgi:hypothetical protein
MGPRPLDPDDALGSLCTYERPTTPTAAVLLSWPALVLTSEAAAVAVAAAAIAAPAAQRRRLYSAAGFTFTGPDFGTLKLPTRSVAVERPIWTVSR